MVEVDSGEDYKEIVGKGIVSKKKNQTQEDRAPRKRFTAGKKPSLEGNQSLKKRRVPIGKEVRKGGPITVWGGGGPHR